jgi:hypothetical protein
MVAAKSAGAIRMSNACMTKRTHSQHRRERAERLESCCILASNYEILGAHEYFLKMEGFLQEIRTETSQCCGSKVRPNSAPISQCFHYDVCVSCTALQRHQKLENLLKHPTTNGMK